MDGALYMAQRLKREVIDQAVQKSKYITAEFRSRGSESNAVSYTDANWLIQALDQAMEVMLEDYDAVHQGADLIRQDN